MAAESSVQPFRRRYVMATAAAHKLGDLSRDPAHLALVYGEDGDAYVGRWIEGFGYFDVRFPKATTRDLTADEIAEYDGRLVAINGEPISALDIVAGGTKRG